MIKEIFEDILNNNNFYCSSNDGPTFESKIRNKLKSIGYSEIIHTVKTNKMIDEISRLENKRKNEIEKIIKKVKQQILSKNSLEIVSNPFSNIKNTFIYQPFGSQQFPDFIIITNDSIIPIEVKFSKTHNKNISNIYPMWNSNLPKPNAIYIFGISSKVATFFLGSDVLDYQTRQVLIDFFYNLDSSEVQLDEKLSSLKNDFGFYPYIRKAYEHKKSKSTRTLPTGTVEVESYFSEKRPEREANVIAFLEKIK